MTDNFVFPAKENDFLGYGSLEAFVQAYKDKFINKPKLGAFKICIDMFDSEDGTYTEYCFIIKDLRYSDEYGSLQFFTLNFNISKEDFSVDGHHLPIKNSYEDMLDYFNRLEKQLNGYWSEHIISSFQALRIHGQFKYFDEIGIVPSNNDFSSRYFHGHKPKSVKEPPTVVSLISKKKDDK